MIRGRLVGSVFGRWPVPNSDHSRDSQASKTRPSRGAGAAGSDGARAQDLARSAPINDSGGRWNMSQPPDPTGPSPDDSSTPPRRLSPRCHPNRRHRLSQPGHCSNRGHLSHSSRSARAGQPSGRTPPAHPDLRGCPYRPGQHQAAPAPGRPLAIRVISRPHRPRQGTGTAKAGRRSRRECITTRRVSLRYPTARCSLLMGDASARTSWRFHSPS